MEKSFDLKNKKITQKIWNNFGLFKDTSFIVIILNREFNLRAGRRIILYFTFFCWTKLLREEIYDAVRGLEKSQNIWGKNKFNCIAGKGRNSVFYYNFAHEFVPWKRSQESSSLNFSEGESKHMLSRLSAQLHRRRRRVYESFPKPLQKPKVIHTYNPPEFGKCCEESLHKRGW